MAVSSGGPVQRALRGAWKWLTDPEPRSDGCAGDQVDQAADRLSKEAASLKRNVRREGAFETSTQALLVRKRSSQKRKSKR